MLIQNLYKLFPEKNGDPNKKFHWDFKTRTVTVIDKDDKRAIHTDNTLETKSRTIDLYNPKTIDKTLINDLIQYLNTHSLNHDTCMNIMDRFSPLELNDKLNTIVAIAFNLKSFQGNEIRNLISAMIYDISSETYQELFAYIVRYPNPQGNYSQADQVCCRAMNHLLHDIVSFPDFTTTQNQVKLILTLLAGELSFDNKPIDETFFNRFQESFFRKHGSFTVQETKNNCPFEIIMLIKNAWTADREHRLSLQTTK